MLADVATQIADYKHNDFSSIKKPAKILFNKKVAGLWS